jgi:hypothetical protein
MTKALYAHMNNKTIKKKKRKLRLLRITEKKKRKRKKITMVAQVTCPHHSGHKRKS